MFAIYLALTMHQNSVYQIPQGIAIPLELCLVYGKSIYCHNSWVRSQAHVFSELVSQSRGKQIHPYWSYLLTDYAEYRPSL